MNIRYPIYEGVYRILTYNLTDGFLSFHTESTKAGMTAIILQSRIVFFLASLFSFIPQRQLAFFAGCLLS